MGYYVLLKDTLGTGSHLFGLAQPPAVGAIGSVGVLPRRYQNRTRLRARRAESAPHSRNALNRAVRVSGRALTLVRDMAQPKTADKNSAPPMTALCTKPSDDPPAFLKRMTNFKDPESL